MTWRFLALLALVGCKKQPAPSGDAGAPVAVASAQPDLDATTADASAPPQRDDAFHVVARGTPTSKVIWLKAMGQRVWLSARNFDAFASADGPLVKGKDIFATLSYKPGVQNLQVVGAWPHLYVLRTDIVAGRMSSPHPTVFAYQPDGTWLEAKPLGMQWFPHAMIGYRDGALLVTGQAELNNTPSYYPNLGAGTKLQLVMADGSIGDPHVDVHPQFVAWDGASDNVELTLLGTIGVKSKTGDWDVSGVHLSRFESGKAKLTAILRGPWDPLQYPYSMKLHEHGTVTVVVAGAGTNVWLVDADGHETIRSPGGAEDCRLRDADLAGDDLYAIRECLSKTELFRIPPSGKPEIVALEPGCQPQTLAVQAPDDLWINADCKGPTIFRRGYAQTPLTLP